MANIWKAQSKVNNKIKRNNHDLSKKSNISLKFGTLYPVFCKKVFPGDSFSIDTAFNLKLLPVVFPVQTKMRAHMHYFYVRNKNLWSGWEDWITGLRTNEETPHPYLSVNDSDIKTSSIHDFLGVPTTVVNRSNFLYSTNFIVESIGRPLLQFLYTSSFGTSDVDGLPFSTFNPTFEYSASLYPQLGIGLTHCPTSPRFKISSVSSYNYLKNLSVYNYIFVSVSDNPSFQFSESDKVFFNFSLHPLSFTFSDSNQEVVLTDDAFNWVKSFFDVSPVVRDRGVTLWFRGGQIASDPSSSLYVDNDVKLVFSNSDVIEYNELGSGLFSDQLHLNALPYRAYESIYNGFYRNTQVDPLIINGRTEYNKFVENMGDGADDFNYHLHQRNYEFDFLTSALPSPQQGVAPLVGMTALGDITIEDENGITTAKATVDDDGTITDVVVTSPAASIEHQRTVMSLAQFGMNIQDFRNANAYLRLLETSIRKGYRYIENILGHWGVAPKHNVLDMPEFIGGFSRDVQVSTVVSSADTLGSDGLSLGDYGGYAQLVGGSKSPVRHFCDDHGFIIGILSVVPTPCYSQLLPKQMIAPTSYLDYYFPEFDQIGYQPITYKEVAPIQSYLDSLEDPNKRLEDTFGYQRPNYDLVGDVDEVHGLFRTDFRNYVINRIFDTRPELGHDFISINPSEINQIFVNTNPDDDCIIGEIGFAVHTKRPVSRVVIPGLGH